MSLYLPTQESSEEEGEETYDYVLNTHEWPDCASVASSSVASSVTTDESADLLTRLKNFKAAKAAEKDACRKKKCKNGKNENASVFQKVLNPYAKVYLVRRMDPTKGKWVQIGQEPLGDRTPRRIRYERTFQLDAPSLKSKATKALDPPDTVVSVDTPAVEVASKPPTKLCVPRGCHEQPPAAFAFESPKTTPDLARKLLDDATPCASNTSSASTGAPKKRPADTPEDDGDICEIIAVCQQGFDSAPSKAVRKRRKGTPKFVNTSGGSVASSVANLPEDDLVKLDNLTKDLHAAMLTLQNMLKLVKKMHVDRTH